MRWIAMLLSILAFGALPAHARSVVVSVTAFTKNGTLTSTGTRPRVGHTVAVSRDLRHLLGQRIYIEAIGASRRVESLTHRRLHRTVDVLVGSRRVAKDFGRVKSKIEI